jgi:transcription initiation factor IIE alpha subunit
LLELAEATLTKLDSNVIEMKGEHFRATVEILAGGHGLPILRLLHEKGWSIASDVASDLEIHTTTASKYLTKLYEVGILDRRTGSHWTLISGKTRRTTSSPFASSTPRSSSR